MEVKKRMREVKALKPETVNTVKTEAEAEAGGKLDAQVAETTENGSLLLDEESKATSKLQDAAIRFF